MSAQEYVYFFTGLTTFLAILAVFAPHSRVAAAKTEPSEEDVIFLDDEDDTEVFIRLPFFKESREDDTPPFRKISVWPS